MRDFSKLVEDLKQKPDLKAMLLSDPKAFFKQYYQQEMADNIDIIIKEDSKDIIHVVFPPSVREIDFQKEHLWAGTGEQGNVSTVASVGSASTISTFETTVFCFATVGTAGSAGSV